MLFSLQWQGNDFLRRAVRVEYPPPPPGQMPKEDGLILIFATDEGLKMLQRASEIGSDGTYEAAYCLFAQLYSLHAFHAGRAVPCVFILTTGQSKLDYSVLLREVSDLVREVTGEEFAPQRWMTDREDAVRQAVKEFFDHPIHCHLCNFHMINNLRDKCQEKGLLMKKRDSIGVHFQGQARARAGAAAGAGAAAAAWSGEDSDEEGEPEPREDLIDIVGRWDDPRQTIQSVSSSIRTLGGHGSLPAPHMLPFYRDIRPCLHPALEENGILTYFENTWLENSMAPREEWSQFDSVKNNYARTTNAIEAFHSALKRDLPCPKPSVHKLIRVLKKRAWKAMTVFLDTEKSIADDPSFFYSSKEKYARLTRHHKETQRCYPANYEFYAARYVVTRSAYLSKLAKLKACDRSE